jgi:hypothetical protein
VDVSTDVDHCGECGNDCDDGETCVSGDCVPLMCGGGELACDGACVDPSSDRQNCGGCGDDCFGGEVCSSGQCTCTGGSCASVGNDGRVVGGSCGDVNPCDAGSTCLGEGGGGDGDFPGGTCSTTCQATADCPDGSACVQVDGDPQCVLTCDGEDSCRNNYDCEGRDNVGSDGETRVCMGD